MAEPSHGDLQRDLGRVEGRIDEMARARAARDEAVDGRFAALERELRGARADMGEIKETLAQGKGGWKVLVAAGGLVGAIAGAVMPMTVRKLFGGG